MKSLHRCLSLLVLLLFLSSVMSCRHAGVHDALLRAEALMETDPHAARALLAEIEDSILKIRNYPAEEAGQKTGKNLQFSIFNLQSKKAAADYAWLKVQADYKCDVPLTSDSLARIATDYYGTPRRPDYHAAMAWYTLGCVYKDMGDDVNGTDAFLKAKSLFPDTLIRYYALTETNLGIHHLNRHMTREAAHEFQSAKQNLIRLGDSTAVAFLDLSLARCCLYREDYASACEWLERVINNPHASDYVFTIAHYEIAKVELYFAKDYVKAHEYLDYNIQHSGNKKELPGTYCLKAITFQEQGQLDSAWHYYNRSLNCWSSPSTSALIYRQMAILAPRLGKADSIADYVRLYHTYIDSLYIISNQQSIRQAENDHRVEMEQQRLNEQHRRLLFGGIAVFVVLCLSLLTLYLLHRNRNNRKTLAIQQAIRQNNVALMNLTVPSEEEKEGTAVCAKSLTDPEAYVRLFRLGRQLLNPEIMEEIKKLNIVSGGEEADRIRKHYADTLDQSFVELMMLLRLAVPSLNKRELHYIISRMLGFDDKDIRTIQKTEDSTFRSQKMRLRQKFPAELIEKLLLPIEDTNN